MKKILVPVLLMQCLSLQGNVWNSIAKASAGIAIGFGQATSETKNFFKNTLTGCSEVVGLGTAYGSAKAGLETAKFALQSSEVVGSKAAFTSAQAFLDGSKKTAYGVLTLADAFAKGLGEGFNIKCIRFFGSLEELEFELTAIILGKTIKVQDKVDVSDITSFAEKIFNKLKDELQSLA